jgi:hypothetical protein
MVVALSAQRPLGELGLQLRRVEKDEPGELHGSGCHVDHPVEAARD